jgi:hypothetical protein
VAKAEEVTEGLTDAIEVITAAWETRNADEVRIGVSHLFTALEPFRGTTPDEMHLPSAWRSDLPRDAHSCLWLIHESTNSLLEHLDEVGGPNWDGIGAASTFAESGVEQLQRALGGNSI